MGTVIAKEDIRSILIVDDSETARMIIRRCFEIAGFADRQFLGARNGKEAWEILSQGKEIDLVVTDLNMPVVDGQTFLSRLKSSAELSRIPVIVITSTSNQAKENELIRMGAAVVLTKPISPRVFIRPAPAWSEKKKKR